MGREKRETHTGGRLTFRGDYLSDPATDVMRTGFGSNDTPYVYHIVGDGRVRLWHNKNGSQSRNKACVTAGGDAILSDVEIPLHMLSASNGLVRLYIEALKRSEGGAGSRLHNSQRKRGQSVHMNRFGDLAWSIVVAGA